MTNFSFLRGASHPEEMVARAAELELSGIGIADRNTLAGVVRAHVFARENKAAVAGMRVAPGARLAFDDGTPDVLAYPKDRAAYGRLCRILTAGNLRAPKGECHLRVEDLIEHGEGLQIVALPPSVRSPLWGGSGGGRRDLSARGQAGIAEGSATPLPALPRRGRGRRQPGVERAPPTSARPSAPASGSARASPIARTCGLGLRGARRWRVSLARRSSRPTTR